MTDSPTPRDIEKDLDLARKSGRWLSDEEHEDLERFKHEQLQVQESNQRHRFKLIILTGLCILLPPLWPIALSLALYLLFPRSFARVTLITGLLLSLIMLIAAGLILVLMIWLLSVLF